MFGMEWARQQQYITVWSSYNAAHLLASARIRLSYYCTLYIAYIMPLVMII